MVQGTAIVAAGETLTVAVNGIVYTAGDGDLANNGDGTWTLTIPAANALPEANYSVTATVSDIAANTNTDPSSGELTVDLTAPVPPTVISQTTNNATPVISGTATVDPGDTLTVVVNGVTYTAGDGNLVDNGDGTWDLTIPANDAFAESTYDVLVSVTDAAGNTTSDSSATELVIDLTAPPVPPVLTGTAVVDPGDSLTVTVDGVTYPASGLDLTDNGDGTWSLTIPVANALPEASYDVAVWVQDSAGNATSDTTMAELIIDTTPPPAPGVTSQTTQNPTPVISGTTTVGTGLMLSVT